MTGMGQFRSKSNTQAQGQHMLDRWSLAASDEGTLWVSPKATHIELEDFGELLHRIHVANGDTLNGRVVFYFGPDVRTHFRWKDMLRLIASFAHYHSAHWRVYENEVPPLPNRGDMMDVGRVDPLNELDVAIPDADSFATVILQGRVAKRRSIFRA